MSDIRSFAREWLELKNFISELLNCVKKKKDRGEKESGTRKR